MTMQAKTIDQSLPVNQGIDFTGCVPGKPAKNPETNKWDHVILPSEATSVRVAIVNSTGAATPATIVAGVRVTSNGNYVYQVKRDTLPKEVQQARQAANEAAKAAWKAGDRPSKAAPKVPSVPSVPGQAAQEAPKAAPSVPQQAAPSVPPTRTEQAVQQAAGSKLTSADIQALRDAGFGLGEIMKALAGDAPKAAPSVPSVPQQAAPSVPSVPKATGKGGTLATKAGK